jgi:signal peptidase II
MKANRVLRNLFILIIIVSNIGCDQISKSIVRQRIDYNTQINVISDYLVLTKVENTGAFLGLGNDIPRPIYKILMIILPLLVIGYTLIYLFTTNNISKLFIIGVSFIIAGGLGNIYDRIVYGSVTDFIHIDFIVFQTGILNMADLAVTTGFFIVMLEVYLKRRKLI